jgi:predicted chitinase
LDAMKGEGTGAKSMAVRFWTTYNCLRAVDAGRSLTVAKRLAACPAN